MYFVKDVPERTSPCAAQAQVNVFEGKNLDFAAVHCCGDAVRDLIGEGSYWIGGTLNVSARHGKCFVPEKIADQKRIRARLRRKSTSRVPEIVRPKIREASAQSEVLPTGPEGAAGEWRVRVISRHHKPPTGF